MEINKIDLEGAKSARDFLESRNIPYCLIGGSVTTTKGEVVGVTFVIDDKYEEEIKEFYKEI